jgi:FdrA protein
VSVTTLVKPSFYRDSVTLLALAREVQASPGVREAAALMATPANRDLLVQADLASPESNRAGPNDLVVAVRADSPAAGERALALAESFLAAGRQRLRPENRRPPRTLEVACRRLPGASLALVSVPGPFAAGLGRRALACGLSAMIFSDNVPLADEISLKRRAASTGLLVLGPDCGTAYVDGVPLGFANEVPRGRVGVVAASGTGLQHLASLLAARGEGLSHGIGVGGRDMTEAVGGLMTRAAIDRLAGDPATELLVMVGKPPAAAVRESIVARLEAGPTPAVLALLGSGAAPARRGRAVIVSTLEDAADAAMAILSRRAWTPSSGFGDEEAARLVTAARSLAPGQAGLRGLYAGGTLAYEALSILEPLLGPVGGNLGNGGVRDGAHRVLDLGSDEFTVGRAHPMLDPALRVREIERAGSDPTVGVLLLDVVLGHGAAADPAGDIAPAIEAAQARARAAGRRLVVVGTVVGTRGDPQGLASQTARLEKAGVWLLPSNARAARAAACVAGGTRVIDAVRSPAAPVAIDPPPTPVIAGARPAAGPLLGRELSVVNVGLRLFAEDLKRRDAPVLDVEWSPPAGGDPRRAALLDLLDDDADG